MNVMANAYYQQGFDATDTTLSPLGVRTCPYKKYTFAHAEWWRGLRAATEIWADNWINQVR